MRSSVALFFIAAAVLAACESPVTQPDLPGDGPRFGVADLDPCTLDDPNCGGGDTGGTGEPIPVPDSVLSVSISGPVEMLAAGTATFTASVSGGTGPYTYTWYYRWCETTPTPGTNSLGCYQQYLNKGTYWQGSTVSSTLHSYDWKYEIGVLVQQDGSNRTGRATHVVWGPADVPEPQPISGGWSCNKPSDYVLTEIAKTSTGQTQTRLYTRNFCTGEKTYKFGT